ncbi:hypothetical protein SUGI_0860330 [Cryptomeria japonica]|nr:hypothetical protein SUGI_0860330 [Cryptomeria japonica]
MSRNRWRGQAGKDSAFQLGERVPNDLGNIVAGATERDGPRHRSVEFEKDAKKLVLSLDDRSALRKVEVIELVEKCVRDATLDKNRLGEVILIGLGVMMAKYRSDDGLCFSYNVDDEMDRVKLDLINNIILLRIDPPRWVLSVVREEVFVVELMRYENIEEEMVQLKLKS